MKYPIIGILGQQSHATLVSASRELFYASIGPSIPLSARELKPLDKIIFRTSSTYTNTYKASIFAITSIGNTVPDNDRYSWIASYNGNAGTGKFLELFPGISMDVAPFTFPESSFIKTIVLRAVSNSTGTMGIYKLPNTSTPVLTISLSNSKYQKLDFSEFFNPDDEIAVKVQSGAFSKPHMVFFIQTTIN